MTLHCLPCEIDVEDGRECATQDYFCVKAEDDGMLSASFRGILLRGRPIEGFHFALKESTTPLDNANNVNDEKSTSLGSRSAASLRKLDDDVVLWATNPVTLNDAAAYCEKARTLSSIAALMFWQ